MSVSNMHPTFLAVGYGKKQNENNAVSNVSNQITIIEQREVKRENAGGETQKVGPIAHNRKQLDTSDTLDTAAFARLPNGDELVALNEAGFPLGETHYNARLTDAQVDAIRDEYEAGQDGTGPKIGYRALATKFGVGKRTIRDIVHYRRRNQWVAKWVRKGTRKRRRSNAET